MRQGVTTLTAKAKLAGAHRVYNLEVYRDHNYMVSMDSLLVHNGNELIKKGSYNNIGKNNPNFDTARHEKINTNGFDRSTVGQKVNNWDKQNEHIVGTKAYINRIATATKPGKKYPSTLTQHPDNLLAEFHSGRAAVVKSNTSGTSIVVRFTKPIGNVVQQLVP